MHENLHLKNFGFTTLDEREICSGTLFLPQRASHDKIDSRIMQHFVVNKFWRIALVDLLPLAPAISSALQATPERIPILYILPPRRESTRGEE
jgi:hypothetical protein